jgi:DNA-binding Lrp family transcriptional regulator
MDAVERKILHRRESNAGRPYRRYAEFFRIEGLQNIDEISGIYVLCTFL